jgi:hypothetical protein
LDYDNVDAIEDEIGEMRSSVRLLTKAGSGKSDNA